MDRRDFLSTTSRATAGLATAAIVSTQTAKAAPNDRVVVCVAGVRGRGNNLLQTFASLSTSEVKYVCDIDEGVLSSRVKEVESLTGRRPEAIKDFRKALDDKSVNALVLGTPDHWHAIPTILACQAKKDVYVEKPDGHNILEGRTMVAAAKKHGRIVQLGTQGRSGPHIASACKYLREGHIGKALFAKAWESSRQGSIGHPADSEPPRGVDYDTWLGPAPKRAFNRNRFHGNWRWFFDYGTGDLGNDGVHRLDNARRGLEAALSARGQELPAFPRSVTATGGKYYFDDDQEWPDTLMVTYDYPGAVLTYEMRIWSAYPLEGESEGAAVFGDEGYVVIGNSSWRAYDRRGKLVKNEGGTYNDAGHAQNFIDCMHSRAKPSADLETVGHPSSMLCHVGNIAGRVGRTVKFDPKTYTFPGDDEANKFLTRPEYRKPWVLPEIA
jgi:predicted dehydrogenase